MSGVSPLTAAKPRSRTESQLIELHAPDLYNHDELGQPVNGLDGVTTEHLDFYREHGYLAIDNAFSPREVSDAIEGMMSLALGEHSDYDGILFEAAAVDRLESLTVEQRLDAIRKFADFVNHEPRLRALSQHPKLLPVLEDLLDNREPKMFQDMGLIKPPRIGREKPWHQDFAYFNLAQGTPVVGVWIALDEATVANGCMRLLDGAHKGGPIIHWKRRDWQICDTEVYEQHRRYRSVAVPLKPGGLMLFDGLLPHGTPHNNSGERRRALQYHYCPADAPWTDEAERLAVFGSEGKDVEC